MTAPWRPPPPPPWPHVPLAEQPPKPELVPPGLRELLEVFGELTRPVPLPAKGTALLDIAWKARDDRTNWHRALLNSRVDSLIDQLQILDSYPDVADEILQGHCARAVAAIRAELGKPLGYEPRAEAVPAGDPA